ncbi:MAG: helix-turn-helix transcriptional regulator [Oscillospiraceae bacterium]|nr:helix-turn-helix transcriptional regulator [Oscillospiraceae bacterium]
MAVKDAVVKRFRDLCAEKKIKPNELASRAGVTPSTVYSMLDESRRDVSIVTIKKLCDGLEITLGAFFSTPEFDALEQEIE